MLWPKVKINISQDFLLFKHKNLNQSGVCFGMVAEYIRHYLKYSISETEPKNELENLDEENANGDEASVDQQSLGASISSYLTNSFFSFWFGTTHFNSSDKSWSAKVARKILSNDSRNFAERIAIYYSTQDANIVVDHESFEFNLSNINNISFMDRVFGTNQDENILRNSKPVALSFPAWYDKHTIGIIKKYDGSYEVYDPNIGVFEETENKEKADKVIGNLLNFYEQCNYGILNFILGFLFGRKTGENSTYYVTHMDKLLKEVGALDENWRPKKGTEKYVINSILDGLDESTKKEQLQQLMRIEDAILNRNHSIVTSELSSSKKLTSAIYPNGSNLIFFAVMHNKIDLIKTLVECGCDVNLQNSQRQTILDYSITEKQKPQSIIKILEIAPALASVKGQYSMTPVYKAVIENNPEIVELLLKYYPSSATVTCNNFSEFSWTPLHKAVSENNPEIVKLLLKYYPSSATTGDMINQTPLYYAASKNNLEMVDLFLKYNPELAKIKEETLEETILHISAKNGYKEMTELIVQYNKELLNERNASFFTPIELAKEKGHTEIVDFLQNLLKDSEEPHYNKSSYCHYSQTDNNNPDGDECSISGDALYDAASDH